uniref:Putative secreted peptide n=1 Tax=Anopheles braziliensis TaxID=58242 RepID=A0A2M3ZW55_9DIPT
MLLLLLLLLGLCFCTTSYQPGAVFTPDAGGGRFAFLCSTHPNRGSLVYFRNIQPAYQWQRSNSTPWHGLPLAVAV